MPAIKTKKKIKSPFKGKVTYSDSVKDYSNEPVFVAKAKRAEEILKKMGLPKETKQ